MVQKTVLKVDISCKKRKKKVLKAVSSLQGIDKIEIDGAKGTLAITGDADPIDVVDRCRKAAGRFVVEVVTIGPPPKPQDQSAKKQEEKKPDEKKQPQMIAHYPCPCPLCSNNYHHYMPTYAHLTRWEEPQPFCTIL
ncbi:heavy metal-associated isoprenylated plant protein 2-like [Impatiens glandulifera]|uniref:heavy metal-associated isoprenylated plant protein 2-like n=1 Tax=Impatiens glandulifera TaxID=253017 RepID=UPI001FB0E7BA|nr:heavy metal-associated isoprenylated plant protein 2-like [Impatiens glandulifera]